MTIVNFLGKYWKELLKIRKELVQDRKIKNLEEDVMQLKEKNKQVGFFKEIYEEERNDFFES